MFPSLLSHELALAHQDDLRREAALARRRRPHGPKWSVAVAATLRVAVARSRPRPAPGVCVAC